MIVVLVPKIIKNKCFPRFFYFSRGEYGHQISSVPETVVFGFRLTGTGYLFGIDEVSRSPITLDESPRARHVHGVPAVPESVVLEANARLVARRLAVTLDHHAVQTSVTALRTRRNLEIVDV